MRVGKIHVRIPHRIFDKARPNRVSANVIQMMLPIFFIPDAVIGEAGLPDFALPIEFAFGSKRKPAFYQLY
jgi:hypothetical protein